MTAAARSAIAGAALLAAAAVWAPAPVFDWLAPRRLEARAAESRRHAPRSVVVVSIDGLAPRVLARSEAPRLARLAAQGTSATRARTTDASFTLAAHTSMLSGVHPEIHGVLWNRYQPWSRIEVPTLFDVCASAGLRCGLFAAKRKFAHFAEDEPGVDRYVYDERAPRLLAAALDYLRAEDPDFSLVHVAEVDWAGHAEGWGSETQRAAVAALDGHVGRFLERARAASERPFVAIVTSDHGGHGKSHGSDRPEDVEIPWIAWGDGVAAGALLEAEVSTVDTAATVVALLGLPVPEHWQGVARLPRSAPGRAQP